MDEHLISFVEDTEKLNKIKKETQTIEDLFDRAKQISVAVSLFLFIVFSVQEYSVEDQIADLLNETPIQFIFPLFFKILHKMRLCRKRSLDHISF